jgi:hypothetical protein
MIHTFIISHERIFPIEKGAKYYKWDEEVIINGEADPFHTENKELGLLKKKRFDLFRFKTTIWKSTNNSGIYFPRY